MDKIKVIDVFAGPGGLSEGFAALDSVFKVAVSIEKEKHAHNTLTLRAFMRQFRQPPKEYYQFLKGELGRTPEEKLFAIPKFKKQVAAAKNEAQCLELTEQDDQIRNVIDAQVGNDECVLIGGPPCQAYSGIGKVKLASRPGYKSEKDPRTSLYKAYCRILARYQPIAFVMENVKGLLTSKLDGVPVFDHIRQDMHDPCKSMGVRPKAGKVKHTYKIVSFVTRAPEQGMFENSEEFPNPKNYIINCEKFGVPQTRHRLILLGLRSDIADKWNDSFLLAASPSQVPASAVLSDLPKLRSGLSIQKKRGDNFQNTQDEWLSTLQKAAKEIPPALRKFSRGDAYQEELNATADKIEGLETKFRRIRAGQGSIFGLKRSKNTALTKISPRLAEWILDEEMEGFVTNHDTRAHMKGDLSRYLYCSVWAELANKYHWDRDFPKSNNYPKFLQPDHKNFTSGNFSERFRVQLLHVPAKTVMSHISKDGHYYIHGDPLQCRSLTVREAARLQTFPDNYFFVGNRTEQYIQVGNAVPPFIATQLASAVAKLLA